MGRDHRGLTMLILIIVQFVSFKQGQMGTWTFSIVKYVVRELFSWKFIERMVGNTFNFKHLHYKHDFFRSFPTEGHFLRGNLDLGKHLFPFLSSIVQVLPLLHIATVVTNL